MANTYVNKVQLADGTSLIDISSDTVTADKLMQGYTAHDRTGALITGTATGAEYTRTVVCPQQTVSSNSRVADLANFPDGFIAGDYYIVTYDGTEYLLTAETMWSSAQVVGDFHIYYEVPSEYLYPFAMGSSGSDRDIAMLNTSQHTVKVEHLELITGGTTLTTKSITSNGTYNASSDSADGYSSVTVNVPTGTPTIQSLTVNPSTTQQTFNASGVDGYKPVTVNAMPSGTAGTPTATKGTVSNHSVSVTPSVTNQTGYITGSTKTGTAVTVSASELVSGNLPITQNGNNIDCANYSTVSVNVSGSSKNTQVVQSTTRTSASTLTAIGAELTVSKTGTYDIYYSCFRTNTSSSYTWATRLYINGTAYGTAENTTWTNNQQNTHLSNISLTTGDKLRVYGRNTRGTSYYICAPTLVIVEA